jgi:hypothetical protein
MKRTPANKEKQAKLPSLGVKCPNFAVVVLTLQEICQGDSTALIRRDLLDKFPLFYLQRENDDGETPKWGGH